MTVYDFLKREGCDFDVYDSEFVICITIGLAEGEDPYAVFIRMLCQSTVFVEKISSMTAIAKWSELVCDHLTEFKQYAKKYWEYVPSDEDELIELWLTELAEYVSGNLPEDAYSELTKLFEPAPLAGKTAVFNA